ncbi:MAG: hypothetical protein AAFW67_13370, partial [Cyanobacteria bacterium J06638_38]
DFPSESWGFDKWPPLVALTSLKALRKPFQKLSFACAISYVIFQKKKENPRLLFIAKVLSQRIESRSYFF